MAKGKMPTPRGVVRDILTKHGLDNKFTIRTVDFTDLARCEVRFVTINDWRPNPAARILKEEISSQLCDLFGERFCVDFTQGGA